MTVTMIFAALLGLIGICIAQAPAPSASLPPSCDFVIVGGGPGGIYSAYRLLESNITKSVCICERTNRVGGRVYTLRNQGAKQDLTVEMGAYRFLQYSQPLITDIITNLLQLPHRQYNPATNDYQIITDSTGKLAGYLTYVEALLAKAQNLGAQLYLNTPIMQLMELPGGKLGVMTEGGQMITANHVILNLPSRPLQRLLSNSMLANAEYNPQLQAPYQVMATKLYLYYDNAWWVQPYNWTDTSKGFTSEQPWTNKPGGVVGSPDFPLVGRWYDGHVRCSNMAGANSPNVDWAFAWNGSNSNANTGNCWGYLQALYTSNSLSTSGGDTSGQPIADMQNSPYILLNNSTPMGARLLEEAHEAIIAYVEGNNISLPANAASSPPSSALLSVWDQGVSWVGGAWGSFKDASTGDVPSVISMLRPFSKLELYVADETFSLYQGWSEGSLAMAESLLRQYFNATAPPWMRPVTSQKAVLQSGGYDDFET